CIISGEAGIGKTRLADEVLGKIAAEQTRLLLLYEKCSRQELNLPYAPVLEAIGNFLSGIPGEDNFESKLGGVLGPEHPLVKPLACVLFEQQNVKLGLAPSSGEKPPSSNTPFLIASFLTQTSLTTPVVLFLDDLHWADNSTFDFIEFLAHRISRTPVVVIATQRPEELVPSPDLTEHPLLRLRKELGRNELAEIIDLAGLYGEDIEEILSNYHSFVKSADFAILAESVRRMVGGNPYYLFEITGLMEDEGYLVKHGDGKWVLKKDLTNFSIPPSINGLIKRRIDRLSLNEILLLRAAAIQGESFEISILERMFTPSGEELQEIIDNLLRNHGLIRALEPGRFAFGHNQVHKAIYNDITKEDLVRGHSEVAKIIRQGALENSAPIPHHRIAHHLALANQPHLAIEHLLEAGKKAIDAQQYHLAIDHLAKANDLLTPADLGSDLSVKLTLLLLESVKPLGERKIHVRAITQLKAISKLAGREDLALRTMLEDCIFLRTISEHDESLKTASDLIQLARELDNPATEAAALKEAGTTSYLMGNMEQAEEYFHLAAGILATTDDRAQLARVYNNLGLVCRNQQRFEEMIRYFERALNIFREIGDSMGERFPLGNLGIVYFERGEYERAFECFSTLKASLGERADLMMEGKVDFSIGEIYLEVGLYDHARGACESALDIFMTIGNRQGESEVLGTLGGIYLAKGDLQIAKEYFRQSVEIKRLIGNAVGMLHSKITLARIANMEGRHDEALVMVKEVLKSARERSLRSLELECLSEIMQAIAQTEGADKALTVLGPSENPEHLTPGSSPALISFAYKAGELAFQTRDENKALKYIAVSGKSVEDILDKISIPEWREAFENKRKKILDTYRRLKPAMPKV
ncbi:MAG: tetratricopeptide repeat protein, partial [bacterium]